MVSLLILCISFDIKRVDPSQSVLGYLRFLQEVFIYSQLLGKLALAITLLFSVFQV